MSSTLVTGLSDVFRSQALRPFAVRAGESESSVLQGFEVTIGMMLTGLAARLKQTGFARQLLDLVNSPANDSHVLEHTRNLVEEQPSDGLASKFTSLLFGNNLSAVTEAIGNVSGLRKGTAASLMSLGAPMLLGSLVQRVKGMDPSGLTNFLSEEADGARGSLPRGVSGLVGSEPDTVPPVTTSVVPQKSSMWVWPVLLASLLILGLIWWFNANGPGADRVKNASNSVADFVTRTLPGNINLRIPMGRMEDNLLAFIQSPKLADETTWFDFDRLLFDTNSATLQPASQEQLQNIAAILKAFPSVHVKVGGYTDNTGDPGDNQALSQQRADTVKQQLVNMGIAADRLDSQGYGSQYPVGDNATEEGRQRNRRISLRVTQK
jgi:outer membrane protein OmpA-like peptidoglycan-associated protein